MAPAPEPQAAPPPPDASATGNTSSDDWERMLAMMDAHHAVHIYGDGNGGGPVPAGGAPQGFDAKDAIPSTDGSYHSADFDTLSNHSNHSEEVQQPHNTTNTFGEGEGGLGDYLGPMMGGAQQQEQQQQQQHQVQHTVMADVGDRWI